MSVCVCVCIVCLFAVTSGYKIIVNNNKTPKPV